MSTTVSSTMPAIITTAVPTMASGTATGNLPGPTAAPQPPTPPVPNSSVATASAKNEFSRDDVFKIALLAGPIVAPGVVIIGTAFTIASLARVIFSRRFNTNIHYLKPESLQKDLDVEREKEAKLKRELELAEKNLKGLSTHVPKDSGNPIYFQLALKILNGTLREEDEDPEKNTTELAWIRDLKLFFDAYRKFLGRDPLYLQQSKAHVFAREFTQQLVVLNKKQQEDLAYHMAKRLLSEMHELERKELAARPFSPKDEQSAWFEEDCARFKHLTEHDHSKSPEAWTTYLRELEDDRLNESDEKERKVRFEDSLSSPSATRVARGRSRSLGGSDSRVLRSRIRSFGIELSQAVRSLDDEFAASQVEDREVAVDLLRRAHEERMAKLDSDYAWELSVLSPEDLRLCKFHEASRTVTAIKIALAETTYRIKKLSSLLEQCTAYLKAKEELLIYFISIFYGGTISVPVAGPSVVMAYDSYSQERIFRKKLMQQEEPLRTLQQSQSQNSHPKLVEAH